MSLLRVKTTERRIGVIGLYNSGKTVFLTSLINHLEHHDPERFCLDTKGARIERFQIETPEDGWVSFPYVAYRDALVHAGKWPEKTRDRSQLICRMTRSDWNFSDLRVNFFDLPGERLADGAMLGRSYEQWSDLQFERIHSDTPYRNCCEPFLSLESRTEASESELINAYKHSLANLILSYKPFITPSTFLLDAHGSIARERSAEELIKTRLSGMTAGQEFVPLSSKQRASNPVLSELFSARFRSYRDELIMPYFKALKSCHSLVAFVDVTTVLAAGVGMYDDNRQIFSELFHVLNPGESLAERMGRHLSELLLPHEWRPSWIYRVAFVAPKLDLVHPRDRDRVVHLLRKMTTKLTSHFDGLQSMNLAVSAVVSTRPFPGSNPSRSMIGIPYRDATGRKIAPGEEQRFEVAEIPADWPANWSAGHFVFPEVYPQIPARKDYPPEQINLDRVFNFLID